MRLDGKVAATFKSEGVGHEAKSLVSLTTNQGDVRYEVRRLKAGGPVPAKRVGLRGRASFSLETRVFQSVLRWSACF